jgi:hypothetical protein
MRSASIKAFLLFFRQNCAPTRIRHVATGEGILARLSLECLDRHLQPGELEATVARIRYSQKKSSRVRKSD